MILYLGLDPERWPRQPVYHYPIIRIERLKTEEIDRALAQWPQFTHVIFTSRVAVQHWWEIGPPFDKRAIAIGSATAELLREKGVEPAVAEEATQEGVIALLQRWNLNREREAYFFCPRSKKARRELDRFFEKAGARFFPLSLYDVVFQKPEPIPDFEQVEEIVFTSPSTVAAFVDQFGPLPRNKKLTPIGPITKEAILYHRAIEGLFQLG